MKVFLKETAREAPMAEEENEENFVRCRLGGYGGIFSEAFAYAD